MMKYLCLVYGVEDHLFHSVESPKAAECLAYTESLMASGCWLAGEALAPGHSATTITVRNHQVAVMDGTFLSTVSGSGTVAGSRSPLVGFYLVTARDLNQAINLASSMPLARVGCIEIRPVKVTL